MGYRNTIRRYCGAYQAECKWHLQLAPSASTVVRTDGTILLWYSVGRQSLRIGFLFQGFPVVFVWFFSGNAWERSALKLLIAHAAHCRMATTLSVDGLVLTRQSVFALIILVSVCGVP